MIFIWGFLALLVVIASFFLAMQSMSDYKEKPKNFQVEYALFLVQNPAALTIPLLESLHKKMMQKRFIISFERLFKGNKRALVIYGPKDILSPFQEDLKLLELEDYTSKVEAKDLTIYPLPVSASHTATSPDIHEHEQVWWQLIVQPSSRNVIEGLFLFIQRFFSTPYRMLQRRFKNNSNAEVPIHSKTRFYAGLNVAIFSSGQKRREELLKQLPLGIPSAYTTSYKLQMFKERVLPLNLSVNSVIAPEVVLKILG